MYLEQCVFSDTASFPSLYTKFLVFILLLLERYYNGVFYTSSMQEYVSRDVSLTWQIHVEGFVRPRGSKRALLLELSL